MEIYFVRHGDPDYENDSLTELGRFQAKKTAENLIKIPFDRVFASSMNRAVETAKYLTDKTKQEITMLDWAREDRTWTYMHDVDENGNGRWFFDVKKNHEVLKKNVGNPKWYENFPPRINQVLVEDALELDKWLLSMNIVHKDGKYEIVGETPKRIVFFAHGGFGLVFYSYILDMDYPSVLIEYGQQELCGVAHFEITNDGAKLISHSKTYY